MTEANHLMKVIRPDDPDLAESRTDSCTACHKNSDRKSNASSLQEWESIYSKQMDAIQKDLKYIRSATKADAGIMTGDLKSKFESVGANVMLLMRDGSHGTHNFQLTTKIMNQAREDLDIVKEAVR